MRDPNRLYKFYDELRRLHMTYMSDIRFGQFISIFIKWLSSRDIDAFNPEEDEMLIYLKEFFGEEVKCE